MRQVCQIAKTIQEMKSSGKMSVGFFVIIERADRNFKDQIKDNNDKLKSYCEGNGFIYVDNDNIKEKSLNKNLPHSNTTDNKLFSKKYMIS